ncbi:hypothetical protein QR680_016041 [Steinernema hermaphroditum]|uniref:Uncharacterized protein n=1 Tax=Steinernema hermaphroditum TaxID=289476 RepID=A0AA39HAV6_9BILA|nr:hypothetical protein QR680_016041 [Steinernema hermaphroditum]
MKIIAVGRILANIITPIALVSVIYYVTTSEIDPPKNDSEQIRPEDNEQYAVPMLIYRAYFHYLSKNSIGFQTIGFTFCYKPDQEPTTLLIGGARFNASVDALHFGCPNNTSCRWANYGLLVELPRSSVIPHQVTKKERACFNARHTLPRGYTSSEGFVQKLCIHKRMNLTATDLTSYTDSCLVLRNHVCHLPSYLCRKMTEVDTWISSEKMGMSNSYLIF